MVLGEFDGSQEIQTHLLNAQIRRKYFEHVSKLLGENYFASFNTIPPHTLLLAVKEIENEAAERAFVLDLYRKSIMETIKLIKQCSTEKCLYPRLKTFFTDNKYCEKMCQTDDSLYDTSVDYSHNLSKPKTECSTVDELENYLSYIHLERPSDENKSTDSDDQIFKQMEELFRDETADACDNLEPETKPQCDIIDCKYMVQEAVAIVPSYDLQNFPPKLEPMNTIESLVRPKCEQKTEKYFYSRWTCEEYFKKKSLREKLDELCEKDFKLHTMVKARFVDLFGYQSDDEQTLESPNTSLDFVRSCRQRIAPWAIKHIKPHFIRYRIPKYLFHPLAKHLIYQYISVNEYPDDYHVYLYIKEYFKHHPRIRCQADF